MSSPLAAAASPAESLRSLWSCLTIRVTWELVLAGVPLQGDTVAEVREHVLRGLPVGASEREAEELASQGVQEWLDRARHGRYRRLASDPDLSLPLDVGLRRGLSLALDPLADTVFKLHYGDGFQPAAVARNAAITEAQVQAARVAIRRALHPLAEAEGLRLHGWSAERLDRLLHRIASIAEPGCPGPGGLLTDEGRAHADRCPRCSRAVRLIRGGALSPSDLFAPEGDPAGLGQHIRVLALLLHPDARRHHERLDQALRGLALPVGADAWLIPDHQLERLTELLQDLALHDAPARNHLRGALVSGSARWTRSRILGPLPVLAVEAARARPWGEIMGMDELPPPLPPPPRATRLWAAASLAVLLCVGFGAFAARPRPAAVDRPIAARFDPAPEGWRVRFQADHGAVIDVVVRQEGQLRLLHEGVRERKGAWATGEGDYELVLPGEEALVISSRQGVPSLRERIEAARQERDPMRALEERIRSGAVGSAIVRSPPRVLVGAL